MDNAKSDGLSCGYSVHTGAAAAAAAGHGVQLSIQRQHAHFAPLLQQSQHGIAVQGVVQGSTAAQMALGASSAANGTMASVERPAKRIKRSQFGADQSTTISSQQQLQHVSIAHKVGTLPIAVASSCPSVQQQPVAQQQQQQHRVVCLSSEHDDERQSHSATAPLASRQNAPQQQDKSEGDLSEFSIRLRELIEFNNKLDQCNRAKAIELAMSEFWKSDPLNASRIMFASLQKMVDMGLSSNHFKS